LPNADLQKRLKTPSPLIGRILIPCPSIPDPQSTIALLQSAIGNQHSEIPLIRHQKSATKVAIFFCSRFTVSEYHEWNRRTSTVPVFVAAGDLEIPQPFVARPKRSTM
jgi:hypothetical protein